MSWANSILALCGVCLFLPRGEAALVQGNVGPVVVDFNDPTQPIAYTVLGGEGGVPSPTYLSFSLSGDSNPTYSLTSYAQGSLTFTGSIFSSFSDNHSLLQYQSAAGPITFGQNGSLSLNWTTSQAPTDITQLGIGAIAVIGQTLPSKAGADVSVEAGTTYESNISVTLDYPVADLATMQLQPEGMRTASVSGILAVSYGEQSASDDSAPSGSVTVNVGPQSLIQLSESNVQAGDPSILMAGISAAAADGPSKKHDGTTSADREVNVSFSGVIENSARSGVGILATGTGAQYPDSSADVAVAAPVTVTMTGSASDVSSIQVTGNTGVGIFAVSDGYPSPKTPHDDSVAGGTVNVSLDQYSSLVTGTASSQFSIGILAVSAGTNALLDPYSSQSVNTDGSGNGGEVIVTNDGTICTTGGMSIGIAALSIGGPGIATNASGQELSYLGGGADSDVSGASSNTVTVMNGGSISTLGASAYGIVAISSGGGGLINNALETVYDSNGNATTGLVIGNGSSSNNHNPGNPGGAVNVTHSGSISTGDGSGTGAASIAIVAQSIGGNGGSAGGKASLFVGDKGGNGGNGGAVTVTTNSGSTITTQDVNSVAILAQSIGGGGGNGGNADGLFVAVGGRGGNGGLGGTVNAYLSGEINTSADHSGGLIAQSIGGGGGHGGGATSIGTFVDTSIGGKGGSGQDAGAVGATAYASSEITTLGNNSAGMLLQSVGGGGGTGGAAYAGAGSAIFSATMSLGGSGGGGGTGGDVTGSNAGSITTGVNPGSSNGGQPNSEGADSIGILLQSIGGGGGHGGSAIAHSLAAAIPDFPTAGFTLTFGGSGGEASHGGWVDFNNTGAITTWGDGSHGILGQSIGGGGGNGGDSTASSLLMATDGVAATDNIAFGGMAGGGGTGETVDLINGIAGVPQGPGISTHGQNAAAIVAQSIGGGGGNGGLGTAKGSTLLAAASADVTVSLGGAGGAGGASEGVTITNYGELNTTGSGSQGILAQSIGGGGGNAGGGTSVASGHTITVGVTLGASGGSGGDASTDELYVTNSNSISTLGGDATGILAQSIGGGGGSGGSSDPTATIGSWTFLDDEGGSPTSGAEEDGPEPISASYISTISIGGHGGSGGTSGSISVSHLAMRLHSDPFVTGSTAQISTAGSRAYGILAQAIGGGGGVGGTATALSNSRYFQNEDFNFHTTINLSGDGGGGSSGGGVTALNTGNILTSGYGSHAFFAQSIGGGGGVGADGSIDVKATIGLGININGESGSGGNGGVVTMTQAGKVQTSGWDAIGVLAQSIGGGGGVASAGTSTPFFQLGGDVSVIWQTVSVTLGFNPRNNTPTSGGGVTINVGTNSSLGDNPEGGTIATTGDWSHAIVAQSIGAGGGKASTLYGTTSNYRPDLDMQLGAASGSGSGGTVNATLEHAAASDGIKTSGYSAYGVVLQSIGGGGGLATDGSASSATQGDTIETPDGSVIAKGILALGAASGVTGAGGAVELEGSIKVATEGQNAHAVVLQSIGGGGGIAGTGSSLQDPNVGSAASVALGGTGATGNGGSIFLQNDTVDISTKGDNAFGFLAQSIGGGGGLATVANSGFSASGTNRLGGVSAVSDSNGGEVSLVIDSGTIATSGDGAHALIAQSIGGGGGIGNPDSANGLTTSGVANDSQALGYGGSVDVNVSANITTSGAGAYGIVLQTIGGGGGIMGDFAGSTGSASSSGSGSSNGTTQLTQSGSISASGANAAAIFAQNTTANGEGNAINLTVNGTVTGGSGANGAGIRMDGGTIGSNGSGNSITVGAAGSVTAISGMAISYTGNSGVNVTNAGVVSGSVNLGDQGTFINQAGATFNSGANVYASAVDNYGTLNPGGNGPATQTVFGQNAFLGSEGALKFDIFSQTSYDTLAFTEPPAEGLIYQAIISGNIAADFAYNPGVGTYRYVLIQNGVIDYQDFTMANLQVTGLGEGSTWSFEIGDGLENADAFVLVVNAVPEPQVFGLLLLAGFAWGLCRMRGSKTFQRCGSSS